MPSFVLTGDARKTYGDYVCFNVLEGCQELLKKYPNLFDQRKPKHFARVIISELEIVKTDMISKCSLQLHDVGVITFKLNGSWIAQRVEKMLINGIDTWAPERRARAVFLSRTNTPYMNDDMLRADCIKHALVLMFLYSGIDVLDAEHDSWIFSCKVTFDGKISESQWKLLGKTQDSEERFSLVHEDNIEFKEFGLHDNVAQFCVLKCCLELVLGWVMSRFIMYSSCCAILSSKGKLGVIPRR
ncbi:hypothetical protein Tco_0554500 [Tanacetum coccineum]